LLGVSRSQVTRWLRGAGIDPANAEKVDLLEFVWAKLLRLHEPEAEVAWAFGLNPSLGDRRPIDLIRAGRAEELMRAIRSERSDAFAWFCIGVSAGTTAPVPPRATVRCGSRAPFRAKAGTTIPIFTVVCISPT